MKRVLTLEINGEVYICEVTEFITDSDCSFINIVGRSGEDLVEIRIDEKENYDDMVKRGVI